MYDPEQAMQMQAIIDKLNEISENTQKEPVARFSKNLAVIAEYIKDDMSDNSDLTEHFKLLQNIVDKLIANELQNIVDKLIANEKKETDG